MCKLNGAIIKEARRLGISHRLDELDREYHYCKGRKKPRDLVDLVEGAVC